MRVQRSDDDDIRELLELGSASWRGPSPSARQALWADEAESPRRMGAFGLAASALCVAVLAFASVTLIAGPQSPAGAATTVIRLVSHVFAGPPGGPAAPPPAPATPAPSASASAAGGVPASSTPPSAARATPRPRPSPTRWSEPSDDRWPSPSPAASPSPSPSVAPSPSPSRPPDE